MKKLFLLLPLLAMGQSFSPNDLPWLAQCQLPSGTYPLNPLLPFGIYHDWDAATTVPGNVTYWIDKVSHWYWISTNVAPPVSDGAGVSFNQTNCFINTNEVIKIGTASNSGDACMAIFNVHDQPGFFTIANLISSECAGGEILLGLTSLGVPRVSYYTPSGNYFPTPTNNFIVDMLWAGTNVNFPVYTNGILMATNVIGAVGTAGSGFFGLDYIGKPPTATCTHLQPTWTLIEFIHWTNVVGFTTTQVSNIHYYAQTVKGANP